MKQFFRFAAVALLAAMTGTIAKAGEWTVPAPAFSPLAVGDTIYIYNVGQKQFINKGESWGTQAVVADAGMKYIVMNTNLSGAALAEGVYKLYSPETGKNDKMMGRIPGDGKTCLTEGEGEEKVTIPNPTCFVDVSDSRNTTEWVIADLGSNVYSIQPIEVDLNNDYDPSHFLGVQLDHPRNYAGLESLNGETRGLWYDLPMSEFTQWAFVQGDAYALFAARTALKIQLELAEAKSIDVTAEGAVFNNAEASLTDIEAAAAALVEKIAGTITPDDPVDMTSVIQNANLDATAGWLSTTGAQNSAIANNVPADKTQNAEGAMEGGFFENWNGLPFTGKMYQTISGLANGVYKVSLAAFVQTFDNDNAINFSQYVYFNDKKIALTAANLARVYTSYVNITDGNLEIGLAQDSAITQWMGLDNARLIYFGNSLPSYQFLTLNMATLFEEGGEFEDDAAFNPAYQTALQDLIDGAEATTTTEEALALFAQAEAAADDIRQNAKLYRELNAFLLEVDADIAKGLEAAQELSDKIVDMLLSKEATNEELVQAFVDLQKELEAARLLFDYEPGTDLTNRIVNAKFEGGSTNGWVREFATGAFNGGDPMECWNGDFRIYQDISGLKNGVYEVDVQAFYRTTNGNDAGAWTNWSSVEGANTGSNTTYAFVFAGWAEQPVANIFSFSVEEQQASGNWTAGGDGRYYPNGVASAKEAFDGMDAYHSKVKGIVADGTLRIGIRCDDPYTQEGRWTLWDNFSMKFLGAEVEDIKPLLDALVATAQPYTTDAVHMTSTIKDTIAIAIAAANVATESVPMLDAYIALNEAMSKSSASIEAYELMWDAQSILKDTWQFGGCTDAALLKEAEDLIDAVGAAYKNGSYTAEEALAKIEEMNAMTTKLKLIEGSDEEPADYTFFITNPNFDGNYNGWTATGDKIDRVGVQNQVMEGWNTNFNVYQEITNLPAGTYQIKCQGFYRYGTNEESAAAFQKGEYIYNGKLYANADTVNMQCVISLDELAMNYGSGTYVEYIDSISDPSVHVTYYIPDMRNAVYERFTCKVDGEGNISGVYPNALYCDLAEGDTLRIGFCNNTSVSNDWTTASFFELYYLGKNSSHAGGSGETAINVIEKNAEIVSTEYYSIDGRRNRGLVQGLNIVKMTDANGRVSVSKVIVKQ